MLPSFIDKEKVPHKPGVYIYKNKDGRVIYVGKAIDLYHRVASYFSGLHPKTFGSEDFDGELSRTATQARRGVGVKSNMLVAEIASVETIIVESELEALILEANLIKIHLPQFNVRLVDDKDYLYIKVTKETYPKVITARKHELKNSLKYFGPFPSSRTVKETLKALRRVFPWCNNSPRFTQQPGRLQARSRACFYYHLSLCTGSCAGLITKEDYMKNIKRLVKLLEGKKDELMGELTKDMEGASKEQNFEEAAKVKKILDGIVYLTQSNRAQVYLENPNFLEDQRILALQELQEVLNLKDIPHRIEGYDISNIQGHESTGSMVVLTDGEIDKSQYRKFKIKMTGKPNDVGMHREMMTRRLKHPEWPLPDLMIIDGGIAQVNGVMEEIRDMRYEIPVLGLAKRMEWLYASDGTVIKLPRSSGALKLVQKLRDEAHRFAITYHRKLKDNATFQ